MRSGFQQIAFSPQKCLLVDLGLIGYSEAWELQRQLVSARKAGEMPNVLLLCEHPPVITLGRNGKPEHLHASRTLLKQMGVDFVATDRGGDITYHGPGQVVGYPILGLGAIRRDVVWYVRQLEEAMIRVTAGYGVAARRQPGMTGVWAESPAGPEKLAAIGVRISRWVTSHGFAYNVSTDLSNFELIVPCGIANSKPTSLERLLETSVSVKSVGDGIARHLADIFGLDLRPASTAEIGERLRGRQACAV